MRGSISRTGANGPPFPPAASVALASLLASALALASCEPRPASQLEAEEAARRTPVLTTGLEPVREAFNDRRGVPRLVAVLSTACPRCFEGAAAVAGPVLDAHPDLRVLMIWTDVLPYDGGARKRVEELYDAERIAHFADPRQIAARSLAAELGWPDGELAYDVFLLFGPEAEWGEAMPEPADWFHQRRDREPERYRTEERLERALMRAVEALAGRS